MPVDASVCIPCPQAPAELFASEPRQGIVEVSCACAFHCAQRQAFNDGSASMLRQKARPDVTAKQVYAQGGAHLCSQHAPAERRISTQAEFAPGQALGAHNYATGSNRANRSSAWHPMSPDMLAYPGSYLPGAAPGAGRHRNVPGTGPSKGCRAAGRTSPRADRNSARRATSCSVQPAAQALSPAQQQYRSTATVLLPATYTHALSGSAQASEAAQGPQRMLALARFSAQRYAGRGTAASDCESTMCDSQVAPMAAARLTTMASDCAGPPQQCYAAGAVANAHSHARRQDQQPSFPAHPKGHMTALKRHNLPTHALKTRLTGLHAAACARMHPRPPPSSAPGLQPQRSVQQPVSARGRSRPHSRARGPAPCAPASARATDAQAGQRRTRHSTRNEPALAAPRMHPLAARCVAR